MESEIAELIRRNIQIGEAETGGDGSMLASFLAPRLAFMRADGVTFDNAEEFIGKVKASDRRTTRVETVELLGSRAIVKCVVTVHKETGDERFHNLRLFVRHNSEWQLLGWANEKVR